MGNKSSKVPKEKGKGKDFVGDAPPGRKQAEIPKDSPLGRLYTNWDKESRGMGSREEMVRLSTQVWPSYPLPSGRRWPPFGTCDYNLCNEVYVYLLQFDPSPKAGHEVPYVLIFLYFIAEGHCKNEEGTCNAMALGTRPSAPESGSKWDPLDHFPPPYVAPQPPQQRGVNLDVGAVGGGCGNRESF